MAARTVYSGSKRKLVLAFDLGTTYSGISYSILDPGQVPVVKGVTKFPAQETISGASKIPTVIFYDRAGKVQAVGAETQTDEAYEKAEDENWVKAEWFKLHLRSKYGKGGDITERIPPLPLNKSVVEVIADFLRYLRKCAETYIRETHANGPQLWTSVENEIDYVLSHPNGWEGSEQTRMRQAAILAGLAPDTSEGHSRITFVTEGEASLHFAVQNGISSEGLQTGNGVIIVDAGGGTVDISTYRKNVEAGDTNAFEEIAAAQCHFHGSVFVSILARLFLEKLLAESRFCDDIEHLVRCFDRTTKPRFRNDQEPQYIKFGTTRDNDPGCGIRYGQLKLNGSDVGSFFTPAIECIIEAVNITQKASPRRISHVVLVGGFSASDWLYQNVHDRLVEKGLTVVRPDNHVNKAVSDGAISFYLDHFVRTRVSKMTYGVICRAVYDPNKPDHVAREHTIIHSVSGDKLVPGWFFRILPRDTQVKETKEFRQSLSKEETSMEHFKELLLSIYCYRGENPDPQWKDVDTANYTVLCTISTDLSHYPAKPQTASNGKTYYEVDYDIVLSFGLTELKAQVAWKENGVEKRGPARVLYDPDDSRDTP